MPLSNSRKWNLTIIGLILFITTFLLFLPPVVGVADQGDYYRLTSQVGLRNGGAGGWDDVYNCWLILPWDIVSSAQAQPNPLRTFSTEEFFARTAIFLHDLT